MGANPPSRKSCPSLNWVGREEVKCPSLTSQKSSHWLREAAIDWLVSSTLLLTSCFCVCAQFLPASVLVDFSQNKSIFSNILLNLRWPLTISAVTPFRFAAEGKIKMRIIKENQDKLSACSVLSDESATVDVTASS